MKKITIIITLILFTIVSFGQNTSNANLNIYEKTDNKTSGDYLRKASTNLIIGTSLSYAGAILAVTTALNKTESDFKEINTSLYALSGVLAVAGTVLIIKGYIDIGKSGNKLNYEMKANELKISVDL
ncbi:MAG: hypothetical protein ACK5KP_05480 [Paludibacteraceae bacterium]